jgi:hypothetical protein
VLKNLADIHAEISLIHEIKWFVERSRLAHCWSRNERQTLPTKKSRKALYYKNKGDS